MAAFHTHSEAAINVAEGKKVGSCRCVILFSVDLYCSPPARVYIYMYLCVYKGIYTSPSSAGPYGATYTTQG